VPVHVKIDTGMGRLGPHYEDAYGFIRQLSKFKNIRLEGIFTHFPAADTNPKFTNCQIDIFNKFITELSGEGINFKYQHSANSIGLVNYPNSHFNMVRPGLILYGISPLPKASLKLKPVLSLKSRIVFIKKVAKGQGVSYGRTYIAKKPTLIATVAVGYADGYPWSLSNCSKVIIKGKIFNVAGRVCMDHIMVDLKDRKDIKLGQEVILLGKSKNVKITAEGLAQWAKTIPYEITSRLSLKIPRIYKHATKTQPRYPE
jgi:alanine racemase